MTPDIEKDRVEGTPLLDYTDKETAARQNISPNAGCVIDGEFGDVRNLLHLARTLTATNAALQAEVLTWRKVAQSATPGGSEYMDPEYTKAFIQERREAYHEAMKAKVLAERKIAALQERVAELQLALRNIVSCESFYSEDLKNIARAALEKKT